MTAKNTEADFWLCVLIVDDEDSCWEWQRPPGGPGYGQFRLWGKQRTTHVISWMIEHGDVPPGQQVCHRCDNKMCVRPKHLWLGTWEDNMDDMRAKHRNGHIVPKIPDEQVQAIRDSKEPQDVLARRYGVTQSMISLIRSGRRRQNA